MTVSHNGKGTSIDFYEIDCLTNGAPHEPSVSALVAFFRSLGNDSAFNIVRIQFAIQLFCRMLKLRHQQYSIYDFTTLLETELRNAEAHAESIACFADMFISDSPSGKNNSIADTTQNHFATMFRQFSDEDFFKLSPTNLEELFKVNCFTPSVYGDGHALDAGCGSGRYSYALHKWFQKVTGIDFSLDNVVFAQKKIDEKGIKGVDFKTGDVTDLPFAQEKFDFVFSNGVLHHVEATYQETLSEIYRVLKSKGGGFLYVMEKPGGILHDTIEICRWVLRKVSEEMTLCIMQQMGFSGYRIYAVLDHIYAPINIRVSPDELGGYLADVGFKDIRRFIRGGPFDDVERVFTQSSDSESIWKFGVGENRFVFRK